MDLYGEANINRLVDIWSKLEQIKWVIITFGVLISILLLEILKAIKQ